uniref:STN domain-containing protein n=1 Tax=Panagrellus redivivus TaxID=6233 RepID=A0A7E4ZYE1_PANRE
MINPKLLVFVAAFAVCGLLPCAEADADGKFRFNVKISLPYDTFDAISVDDIISEYAVLGLDRSTNIDTEQSLTGKVLQSKEAVRVKIVAN